MCSPSGMPQPWRRPVGGQGLGEAAIRSPHDNRRLGEDCLPPTLNSLRSELSNPWRHSTPLLALNHSGPRPRWALQGFRPPPGQPHPNLYKRQGTDCDQWLHPGHAVPGPPWSGFKGPPHTVHSHTPEKPGFSKSSPSNTKQAAPTPTAHGDDLRAQQDTAHPAAQGLAR